jgi:curved DNA-binding protein CbpA
MGTPRDYYADLELPPTADVPEIRKQYRKLALKYHPDRNPGREQEVNTKFQIIQTAHEILSDPEQKAKHDASRGRGRFPGASGVKGNPWSNVSAQYPPPPRRNNGNTTTNNNNARTTPSGAQRWQTRFSSGVPPTAKQYTASDAESKKNAARAFENMRKGTSAKTNEQPRPPPPPPPPRTESARQRAEASFGSRKTGFHPRTAMGDEPPVSNSNYSSRPASERYSQSYAQEDQKPPAPPPRPQPTTMPDPLSQFRDRDSWADPRQSSPYSSNGGGEKTNPFDSIPINRAKSTRDANRQDQDSPEKEAFNRQRSASAPKGGNTEEDPEQPSIPRDPADRPKAQMKKTRSGFKSVPLGPNQQATEVPGTEKSAESPSGPSIFSFPVNDETFRRTSPDQPPFSRRNTDDIDTSFVEEENATDWEFNAGGAEQGSPTKARKGRRSPGKRPAMSGKSTPSFVSDSERPDSTKPESGFNPTGWDFGPQTFVPQPSKSVSPTRLSRKNSRKPRGSKKPDYVNVGDDSSSEDEVLEWRGRKVQDEPPTAESPQAMDIDTPPVATTMPPPRPPKIPSPQPPQMAPSPQPAQPMSPHKQPVEVNQIPGAASHTARNIYVETSRPEWREANVDNTNGIENQAEIHRKPINPNNVGSEDSEEFLANFADLRNVAPFTQQSSGLKSFSDLKDNLPFESKAAPQIPIKLPTVHPLVFPDAPLAPQVPTAVLVSGVQPSAHSWETYVKDFENYMKQWDVFNAQVVDHFATRKSHIARTRAEKGYSFLETRGDADIQEYYNWLEQDIDVRRRWAAACDEHEQRFREFMAFRMKMM